MEVSEQQVIDMIFKACNVDYEVEGFTAQSDLFGDDSPLGLDSLDAVEIVPAVKKDFGITIQGENNYFETMKNAESLTRFINSQPRS